MVYLLTVAAAAGCCYCCCGCRLTDSSHIHELGQGVDHGNVLSHPEALSALRSVLTHMVGGDQPIPGQDADEESGGDEESVGDEDEGGEQSDRHGGTREVKAASVGVEISLSGPFKITG